MAYIDLTYYKDVYMGTDPDDDVELQKLINRASDIVDILTRYRIIDFDSLADFQKTNVEKATAAQTEYLVSVGENYNTDGSVQSVKIGKFSYNEGGGSSDPSKNSMSESIAPLTRQYLFPTGLAYAGV